MLQFIFHQEGVLRFFGRALCLFVTIAVKQSDGGWCGSLCLSIDYFKTRALRCSRLPSAAELGVAERGSAKAAAVEGDAARESQGGRCEAGGAPSLRGVEPDRVSPGGRVTVKYPGVISQGGEYQMYLLRLNLAV